MTAVLALQNEISWRKDKAALERGKVSQTPGPRFGACCLICFYCYIIICCVTTACLCQVSEVAGVYLCVLSQKYKHLDLLWFACLKWTFWWKLLQFLEQYCKLLKADFSLKGIWRSCLYIYNTTSGVWFVKRNLIEFCQHTHRCGSGLKRKLPFPAQEMAFLVRCYANCLQPWASKVSNCYFLLRLN